jgi:hypothetical protein
MGKRHSPEQIVRKLRQAEARLAAGATVRLEASEVETLYIEPGSPWENA